MITPTTTTPLSKESIEQILEDYTPDKRGQQQVCLLDSLSEEDKAKPIWLHCPCPKCSVWC